MSDKLDESLKSQKEQLASLLAQKEQAEGTLKQVNDIIPQLKGAIQALEYVKTLGLVEPKDSVPSDPALKRVK